MGSNLVGYSRLDAGLDEMLLSQSEADRAARERKAEQARRVLEGMGGAELDDIRMMLGLIPSPPPGSARREAARQRAKRQRQRAKLAKLAGEPSATEYVADDTDRAEMVAELAPEYVREARPCPS